jgi:hypothetical protein
MARVLTRVFDAGLTPDNQMAIIRVLTPRR